MDMKNPSLADVQARRKQIAEEDKMLAQIEQSLLDWAKTYGAYQASVAKSAATPVLVQPSIISSAPLVPTAFASGVTPPKGKRTKKQLMIEALSRPRPLWQTAKQVQEYMEDESGKPVPMSSVSPALTDLKNSETITRDDLMVALTLRLEDEEPTFFKENEPPKGGSETGEPASSPNDTQGHESGNE